MIGGGSGALLITELHDKGLCSKLERDRVGTACLVVIVGMPQPESEFPPYDRGQVIALLDDGRNTEATACFLENGLAACFLPDTALNGSVVVERSGMVGVHHQGAFELQRYGLKWLVAGQHVDGDPVLVIRKVPIAGALGKKPLQRIRGISPLEFAQVLFPLGLECRTLPFSGRCCTGLVRA